LFIVTSPISNNYFLLFHIFIIKLSNLNFFALLNAHLPEEQVFFVKKQFKTRRRFVFNVIHNKGMEYTVALFFTGKVQPENFSPVLGSSQMAIVTAA
jgi:hypothetical protein